MNGPSFGMYKVDPLYDCPRNLELPQCMYTVRNVFENDDGSGLPSPSSTGVKNETKKSQSTERGESHGGQPKKTEDEDDDDLKQLEGRQQRLLTQLEDLANRIQHIKQRITPSSTSTSSNINNSPEAVQAASNIEVQKMDVVVHLPPTHNPVAFFTLSDWMKAKYGEVALTWHLHSSVEPCRARAVKQRLDALGSSSSSSERCGQPLKITLIFRETNGNPDPWMLGDQQRQIRGEVNIVRYLAHILAASSEAENVVRRTQIDSWLDEAHASFLHGGAEERRVAIRLLENHLSHASHLVGEEVTVADIAVISALLQTQTTTRMLPTAVKRWLTTCCAGNPSLATALNQVV